MKQKNTKELDDILGKTHISDFDKFCVEQKGSVGVFWRKSSTPSLALSRFLHYLSHPVQMAE